MDEVTAEIKSKIDIVDLVTSYLPLKKAGRNYQACCPFHHEKTASFMVSSELQIFKCFGCQEGGDIFSFVTKIEGIDFPAALKLLADRAGVKLKSVTVSGADSRKEKIYAVNHLAAEFFHFLLAKHKTGEKAREYLKERRVSQETSETFCLGYAPSSWRSLSTYLIKKGYSLSEMVEAGLSVPRKGSSSDLPVYDRFRARLIFPLRDNLGRVIGFSGRSIGSAEPKYLNSPETPVFKKGSFLYGLDLTKQEIKKVGQALMVEGQFDLILPYQEGFRSIVASLGTALTDQQLKLLSRFTNKVVLAFDQDAAGSEALVRSVSLAENLGFTVSALNLPEGVKDPDEAVRFKKGEFSRALENNLPFYDYYLILLTRNLKKSDIREKKNIAERFLMQLTRLESPLVRSHYLKELSRVLEMDQTALTQVLESLRSQPSSGSRRSPLEILSTISQNADRAELLQKYLLSLLLNVAPEIGHEALVKVGMEDFANEKLRMIFSEIKKALAAKKATVDAKTIRDKLDESTTTLFDDLYLLNLTGVAEDRDKASQEIDFVIAQLKREAVRKEMQELSLKIKKAEKEGSFEEVELWQRELQKIAEKIK